MLKQQQSQRTHTEIRRTFINICKYTTLGKMKEIYPYPLMKQREFYLWVAIHAYVINLDCQRNPCKNEC